ncbi:MAG: glycine cleavage system protein T, partial [Thermoguttaceae bacterium]|nr:glycine cleavage system protein T [Thermoguttaceae bacterium]
VGYVTSGSPSPTLGKNIAMGYVKTEFAEPDTMLTVDIRGNKAEAKVVPLPFYKRAKK